MRVSCTEDQVLVCAVVNTALWWSAAALCRCFDARPLPLRVLLWKSSVPRSQLEKMT